MILMAIKYYAVKEGRVPGIYTNWDECQKQIKGYSNAKYKSFEEYDDAYEYLSNEVGNTSNNNEIPRLIIYVDGSYNENTNEYALGAVIIHNGNIIKQSHKFNNKAAATMRNVAGEIEGAMYAMDYAIAKQEPEVHIYYDYAGIEKWCSGEWEAKNQYTRNYVHHFNETSRLTNICFHKVKGHSGNRYNDLADRLAKDILGIK